MQASLARVQFCAVSFFQELRAAGVKARCNADGVSQNIGPEVHEERSQRMYDWAHSADPDRKQQIAYAKAAWAARPEGALIVELGS